MNRAAPAPRRRVTGKGGRTIARMARRERDILERAVHSIAERASQASAVVDEAHNAGLDGSHPVTLQAKMLRFETPEREGRFK